MNASRRMDLGNLTGRVAVVTSANFGIGFETAFALAGVGAHVVLGGRSQRALNDASATITAAHPRASLSTGILNLAELASVRAFAAQVSGDHQQRGDHGHPRAPVDGRRVRADLQHQSPGPLCADGVLVTRTLHTGYAPMKAYARSKFANVAFAVELAQRATGTRLTSVAVHPGTAMTGLQQHLPPVIESITKSVLEPLIGHSPAEAASPSLYAAASPSITSGKFYAATGRFEMRYTRSGGVAHTGNGCPCAREAAAGVLRRSPARATSSIVRPHEAGTRAAG